MKKACQIIMYIILSSILCACSDNEKIVEPTEIVLSVAETLSHENKNISAGIIFTPEEIENENARKYLNKRFEDFDYYKYESFALYISAKSNVPDEFGILKLREEKDIGYTALMLKKHINYLYTSFENQGDAIRLIRKAKIRKSGYYIYYAVTNQNEHILTYIENMLVNR